MQFFSSAEQVIFQQIFYELALDMLQQGGGGSPPLEPLPPPLKQNLDPLPPQLGASRRWHGRDTKG